MLRGDAMLDAVSIVLGKTAARARAMLIAVAGVAKQPAIQQLLTVVLTMCCKKLSST
jgi:hypothetical protein